MQLKTLLQQIYNCWMLKNLCRVQLRVMSLIVCIWKKKVWNILSPKLGNLTNRNFPLKFPLSIHNMENITCIIVIENFMHNVQHKKLLEYTIVICDCLKLPTCWIFTNIRIWVFLLAVVPGGGGSWWWQKRHFLLKTSSPAFKIC